jgi:hypothetical protein
VNFIKDRWNQLIDFLQYIPWLKVVVVLLMSACTIQICVWINDTVDINRRLKIAVDTATKYAGELEKENIRIRETMSEADSDPEVWGLRIISDVIAPRVNILAIGIPRGKEKALCKITKEMLNAYSQAVVTAPTAQRLMEQQRSFLKKLIQVEQKFITTTCNKFK